MYYFNDYSGYLKRKYGTKVYKLPVNLPVTCPNRDGTKATGGCSFCAAEGAGFESLECGTSVSRQLDINREYMGRVYKAQKFIAYLQNYTNTWLPVSEFEKVLCSCAESQDIVEISVSTRPDCVGQAYLDAAKQIEMQYNVNFTFELGLQSVNTKTLRRINRGHTLGEYISAVKRIKNMGMCVSTHLIPNLPYDEDGDVTEAAQIVSLAGTDTVKLHNLFLMQNTPMAEEYLRGEWQICSYTEYFNKVAMFLRMLSPNVSVERFFARCPEPGCVFSNWGRSWRWLHNELLKYLDDNNVVQGSLAQSYTDGLVY